jgi:hypothetical protein
MKNFIIISPHFPQTYYRFAEALKRNGFRVLGIGDASFFELSLELRNALDEYYCCYDMEDFENEKHAVQHFRNKYGEIDYLESNNEYWLERDSWLRNDFNIKNGVRPQELQYWQHKSKMKELYKKAGAKVADYVLVKNKEQLLEFINRVGYPVFIKPDMGVGASDDYKIKSEEDIDLFFQSKNNDITYICEQFITGNIVSFDGICDDQSNVVFCASNVFPPSVADVVQKGEDLFYYTAKEVPADLKELGEKVIKAFGVKKRFFHLEFFRLTKTVKGVGKKGELVALETNMRPAGGFTPDLINFSQSVNSYQIYADVIAFNENRQDMSLEKYYAACASRRDYCDYLASDEDILNKYPNNICTYGRYPDVLSSAMGNKFFMAKFDTLEEVEEFRKYCETRK